MYIPSKQERYGIKLFMACESETGYVGRFVTYTGSSTKYIPPNVNVPFSFEHYKSPSQVVLSLCRNYLNQVYCITLDNYYISPEIASALLSLGTDCIGTLCKKQHLPKDFWNWKLIKGNDPTEHFDGDIMVLLWSDPSKIKLNKNCQNALHHTHRRANSNR